MRNRVTIQQIAEVAGVSKYAVSRALSGKPGVSLQTREKILRTAGQLGYFAQKAHDLQKVHGHPQQSPERMADPALEMVKSIKHGTFVMLFPNIRFQNKDSVYWGPVFDGATERLQQYGLDVITITEPSFEPMFSVLNPDKIDGIITLGYITTRMLLDIQDLGIPVVMVDHFDPTFQCDMVFTDNMASMRELVTKLVSKGYKKMQFVGNIHEAHSFYERWLAFRSVLEEHQLPYEQKPLLLEVNSSDEIERAVIKLNPNEVPDVFVCANDFNAIHTISGLQQKGLHVPDDCAVTGFDNAYPDFSPSLTTVEVDKKWMGMRAVDKMLWRIAHPDAHFEKILIQAKVIIRESSAK